MNTHTEAAKILRQTHWYPAVALSIAAAGAIGALAAIVKVAVRVLLAQ